MKCKNVSFCKETSLNHVILFSYNEEVTVEGTWVGTLNCNGTVIQSRLEVTLRTGSVYDIVASLSNNDLNSVESDGLLVIQVGDNVLIVPQGSFEESFLGYNEFPDMEGELDRSTMTMSGRVSSGICSEFTYAKEVSSGEKNKEFTFLYLVNV